MAATTNHTSVEKLNQANEGKLPGHLGLVITEVADGKVVGRLKVRQDLVATPEDARAWGRRLAPAIGAAVAMALN